MMHLKQGNRDAAVRHLEALQVGLTEWEGGGGWGLAVAMGQLRFSWVDEGELLAGHRYQVEALAGYDAP
jgi:hypothetical protein